MARYNNVSFSPLFPPKEEFEKRLKQAAMDVGKAKEDLVKSVNGLYPLLRDPSNETIRNQLSEQLDAIVFKSKHFIEMLSINNVYGKNEDHLTVLQKLFARLKINGDITPEKIDEFRKLLKLDVSLDDVIAKLSKDKNYQPVVENILTPAQATLNNVSDQMNGFLDVAKIQLIQQHSQQEKVNYSHGQF